jgi:hypothetical protein
VRRAKGQRATASEELPKETAPASPHFMVNSVRGLAHLQVLKSYHL